MIATRLRCSVVVCLMFLCLGEAGPLSSQTSTLGTPKTSTTAAPNPADPDALARSVAQIQRDVEKMRERKRSFWDSDVWAPFAAALLVAIGGWATTLYVFRGSQVAQREALERQSGERIEDNLFDGLKLFGGGSQNRSLGLALLTGYWNTRLPAIHAAWRNVLVAQAIHLLTNSEERDSLVELENLRVIMEKLHEKIGDLPDAQRAMLLQALQRAESDPRGEITKEHPTGTPLGITVDPTYLDQQRTLLAARR
jgi:hypothetical protein